LYKPWAMSMGDSDFRTRQVRDPSTNFHKLETYKYLPDATLHAKGGYVDVGGLSKYQFDA